MELICNTSFHLLKSHYFRSCYKDFTHVTDKKTKPEQYCMLGNDVIKSK